MNKGHSCLFFSSNILEGMHRPDNIELQILESTIIFHTLAKRFNSILILIMYAFNMINNLAIIFNCL